jgi:hypothetical protein
MPQRLAPGSGSRGSYVIASAFPRAEGWGWEVLTVGGELVATGHATTPEQARRLSTRAWLDACGGERLDLGDLSAGQVHFGGIWGR